MLPRVSDKSPVADGAQSQGRQGRESHGVGADQGAGKRHEQRRAHPFIGHIRRHQPPFPAGQWDKVIKIARGFVGRNERSDYFPAGDLRSFLRQDIGLDPAGHDQLAFQNLFIAGLERRSAQTLGSSGFSNGSSSSACSNLGRPVPGSSAWCSTSSWICSRAALNSSSDTSREIQ